MITTPQIKQLLAQYAKVDEAEASAFVDALVQTVVETVKKGESVTIAGLGTFEVIEAQQGELKRLVFVQDEKIREAVNAPFACFEPFVVSEAEHVAETADESVEPIDEEETVAMDPVQEPEPEEPAGEPEFEEPVEEPELEEEPGTEEVSVPDPEIPEKPEQPVAEEHNKKAHADVPSTRRTSFSAIGIAAIVLVVLAIAGTVYWFMEDVSKPVSRPIVMEVVSNERVDQSVYSDSILVEQPVDDNTPMMVMAKEKSAEKPVVAKPDPTVEKPAQTQTAKPVAAPVATQPKPAQSEPKVSEPAKSEPKASEPAKPQKPEAKQLMSNSDGTPKIHVLAAGERLTVVALDVYGDKAFWGYIYDVNAFQIPNPNNVPVGTKLYLPDPSYYNIDASDPASVRKASNRSAKVLNP